jgi:hypothetical protein
MKKITVWMMALMLVSGVVVLAGCKKAEETDNAAAGEAYSEATPTPMEPMVETTPVPEVTPMAAEATPTPAAQ